MYHANSSGGVYLCLFTPPLARRVFDLPYKSHSEAMLDGLGIRMCLGQFLLRALEICPRLFDIGLQLGVIAVQLLVIVECRVLDVVVLLPCVRRRPLHADLNAVVLQHAGEGARQPTLGDKGTHGLFYLRTLGFNRFFTLVSTHLFVEHLVNDLIIDFRHNAPPSGGLRAPHCEGCLFPNGGAKVQVIMWGKFTFCKW